jgi:CRP/FNR family cyclic AMP-dependent transcriptional regulator
MVISFISQKDKYQEALEQFLMLCDKKVYPAKTSVIRPGDKSDKLYFIMTGSVRICVASDDGKQELILAYINKNQFIGELGIFKAIEEREVSVKTRSQCHLAEISYSKFHQLLNRELRHYAAELLYLVGVQIAERLLVTNRKFYNLAFMDVEGRIARTLLDLCKEPDAITHPEGMQLYISRQEIALIVGCSREMAGRVLKEMEHKKLISAHGKTIVVFGTR